MDTLRQTAFCYTNRTDY